MIKINEEFKNLIPPLSAEEFNQLEENILADGCRDPIVLWGDILIDGHNRLKICEEHGYPYKTITKDFSDSDSVKLWIIQNQFGRRNLTDFQRAELALQAEPLIAARARENLQATGKNVASINNQGLANLPKLESINTRDELAEMSGLSARNISKVKNIIEDAAPSLIDKVRIGEVSIHAASEAASLPAEEQEEIVREIDSGEKPSDVIKKHVLATKHTGDEESYTPIEYLESAREVLGKFDLDPASNKMAQENVRADLFYTVDDNGLDKEWSGKVWMNPPYTARVINAFISKLVDHYKNGDITDAIVLTNNNTDTSWFHEAANTASAVCFTAGRINFLKRDGSRSSPTNGQSFIYFGKDIEKFKSVFSKHGIVMVKA